MAKSYWTAAVHPVEDRRYGVTRSSGPAAGGPHRGVYGPPAGGPARTPHRDDRGPRMFDIGTVASGRWPAVVRMVPATGGGRGDGHGDGRHRARPVMLMTLQSTPFAPDAAALAIDLAIENAAALIVVNVVDCPVARGPRADLGDPPAVAEALRAPAARAAERGVVVRALRVRSQRPLATLVDLVGEHAPGVVVFGPDPARLSRLRHASPRRYRRAMRALEARTTCLLWRPDGEPPAPRPAAARVDARAPARGRLS